MALNYIPMDPEKGAEIQNLLKRMSADLAQLAVIRDSMTQKLDGDGSQDSHYTALILDAYGYPTAADAHRSYAEINSAVGNSTALTQCAAYHRRV